MSIGMALGGRSNFAGSSCGRRGSPENRCPQSFNLSLPRHFPHFLCPTSVGFGHSARILATGWAALGRRAFSYGRARRPVSRHRLMQRDLKRLLAYSTIENAGIVFIGLGLALAFKANGMAAAAALAFTAALLHALNHSLFKSLLFFGAGAVLNTTGRVTSRVSAASSTYAANSLPDAWWMPVDLGAAATQWICIRVAGISGHSAEPGIAAVGTQADGASGRCHAGVGGGPVRCLLCARLRYRFPGSAGSAAVTAAVETDGFSRAAMGALLILCLLLGIIPGIAIDAIAPVTQRLVGQSMPPQAGIDWLSIVPIAESRSSYSGLLVFVFITLSTPLVIEIIHRFASRAVRRGPTWDCGYPDPSPVTQYTADSFSQLIRRVFGPVVFQARERVDMPLPGDARPARLTVTLRDLPWDAIYVPIAEVIWFAAEKLNTIPDHPQIPEPGVRGPRRAAANGCAMALSHTSLRASDHRLPGRRRRGMTPVMVALWSVLGATWRTSARRDSRGDGLRPGAWSMEPALVFASLSSLLRLPTSSMQLARHHCCDCPSGCPGSVRTFASTRSPRFFSLSLTWEEQQRVSLPLATASMRWHLDECFPSMRPFSRA